MTRNIPSVQLCLRLLAVVVLVITLWPPQAMAATGLEGQVYNGLDEAEGARLRIGRGGGAIEGVLSFSGGRSFPFSVSAEDGGLTGRLARGNGESSIRIDPLPFGALVTVIPVGPGGALLPNEAEVLTFVRQDVEVPSPPEGFVLPPEPGTPRFAPLSFMQSYAFWPPSGVARGYAALAPRHRTMIGLFPAVQLDIIWKLCLAPAGAPGADEALRLARSGQGVSCRDVLAVIAELQRGGGFAAYKADVEEASTRLRQAIRCAEYFVETVENCQRAGRYMSEAAVSLETAASVLDRYR